MSETTSQTSHLGNAFEPQFREYFARPFIGQALESISKGAQVEFAIAERGQPADETFHYVRSSDGDRIEHGPADRPDFVFTFTPSAARSFLAEQSEDIGHLGIHAAKLMVSPDPSHKLAFAVKANLLSLWGRGYAGVIKAGGAPFAAFLAEKGLKGIEGIKAVLKTLKK